MIAWDLVLSAVGAAPKAPNLWGALGCAMAYAVALLAALDAFADMLLARVEAGTGLGPVLGLKFGGKLAAAGITVSSAAIVLALDSNWFAFTALSAVFLFVVVFAIYVMRRNARSAPGTVAAAVQEPQSAD